MKIPLSAPDLTQAERQAVQEVLLTRHLALGPTLRAFEERIAAYHGRAHAVAVNSGTSALHLALLALGAEEGDEVITTPFSFVASANCVLYVRGTPKFIDISPSTWNLEPAALETALTSRTKGIIPVHVFGLPCDMERIGRFASDHGLWVLEDACEAIGAQSGNQRVGKLAQISVLAFYPNKQITTGEGGVLLTDDADIAALCRSLRNQGRSESGGWLNHERLGFNYRLSDISAALGLAQLERIDEILEKRATVAANYMRRLRDVPWLRFQQIPPGVEKSWFVFVVALTEEFSREDRDAVLGALRDRGIECSNYFTPIHLQPYMAEQFGLQAGAFPKCEELAARTIALPFFNNLQPREIQLVCDAFLEILEKHAPRQSASAGSRPDHS